MRPRGLVIDLFAGPGGWDEGLAMCGHSSIGIEKDRDACLTGRAAGHTRIRADVEQYPTEPFAGKVEGLIASPPCTDFSSAGKGAGVDGDSGRLIFQVPRWVEALRPRWIACEQVPSVLGYWRVFAHEFERFGYRTWCGMLDAADYGVPQNRKRAFLLASLDRVPVPPKATHAREPGMFGGMRWVSMADALGWAGEVDYKRGAGLAERHGDRPARSTDRPAPTLTGAALGAGGGAKMFLRTGNNTTRGEGIGRYEREVDRPAPTLDAKVGRAWTLHTNRDQRPDGSRQTRECTAPAPALTAKAGGQWSLARPSTTVCGDPRIAPPGHHERQMNDAIKITVREALILQSFPSDYPVQGNKTSQFRQIGNAVPPRLAAHVLTQLIQALANRDVA